MATDTLFDVDETLTVGQVTRRLSEAVRRTFSKEIWVQGQIRNLSRSSRGHVYFDLVDPVPAGTQPKASIAVTLFDSNRQVVNRTIKRTGNSMRMDDGVEVRIKAQVEMYTPRGQVQLNMSSIDPEFTLGRLGADRDQLLRELQSEGLIDANSLLPMPLVPLRVALITSGGSAAHADFHEQIAASAYAFEITTLSTRVQGEFASQEIAQMISAADELDVDVIALVRGGGARTDLAAFDASPVARAIAAAAHPVLCGIGHEIDSSVADLVAHSSLKTPTACAQFLIERLVDFDFMVADRAERLARLSVALPSVHRTQLAERARSLNHATIITLQRAGGRNRTATANLERRVVRAIAQSEQRLTSHRNQLAAVVNASISASHRQCDRAQERLLDLPARHLRDEQQRLNLFEARLSAVDPAQALRRGYTITTTVDGRLVRHAGQVTVGADLITRLADGSITSRVTASDRAPDAPAAVTEQDDHDL